VGHPPRAYATLHFKGAGLVKARHFICPRCGSGLDLRVSIKPSFRCSFCGKLLKFEDAIGGRARGPVAAICFVFSVFVIYASGIRGIALVLAVPVMTLLLHMALTVVVGFIVPAKIVSDDSEPVSLNLKF
jgi:uncharacterized protein (DUF983 family)